MTALAYAATAVIGVLWVLAFVGAVAVLTDGVCRLVRWLHRGEL